jgi:hypothetical protein
VFSNSIVRTRNVTLQPRPFTSGDFSWRPHSSMELINACDSGRVSDRERESERESVRVRERESERVRE